MQKVVLALLLMTLSASLLAVPAHPLKHSGIQIDNEKSSKIFGPQKGLRSINYPDSVLALMVAFQDASFDTSTAFPDSFPHNQAYYERYLYHLASFWSDASHGQCSINGSVYNHVIVLPKPMAYYGNDANSSVRIAEFARDAVNAVDPDIDFNQYDALIIFHAGGGQESDVFNAHADELWSTFLTQDDIKEALAPEDEQYQGITTQDGRIIREVTICPESEWQPEFTEGSGYNFGLIGVLCHEFGHQIGLPTLFDNRSANGRSAGIGNWGIMGTASWNGNGFVPPLPEAWSRYYMGWETPITIDKNTTNLAITYPMRNSDLSVPRMYKVPISDTEYFLIENRQQNYRNPTIPSFSFNLLPPGQQNYYPAPYENVPRFNFMTNSYKGCEWDFYLPHEEDANGNVVEFGSGILIWHIDDNVINANFSPNLFENSVNGNQYHKGVDLEEADGIQQMDSNTPDVYMRGSGYDSYRSGNNTYFGYAINPTTGTLSLPSSESYYGEAKVEIYNISESDSIMHFSVRFATAKQLPDLHSKVNTSILGDANQDGIQETMITCDGGEFYVLQDTTLIYSNVIDSIQVNSAFDEKSGTLLMAGQNQNYASFYIYRGSNEELLTLWNQSRWITHPVVLDSVGFRSVLAIRKDKDVLFFTNSNYAIVDSLVLNSNEQIITNLVYARQELQNGVKNSDVISTIYTITKVNDDYSLLRVTLNDNSTYTVTRTPFTGLHAIDINYLLLSDVGLTFTAKETPLADYSLYSYSLGDNDISFLFKYPLHYSVVGIPSVANIDNIYKQDLLVPGNNGFQTIDYAGNRLNRNSELAEPDSSGVAGSVSWYHNESGEADFIGTMAHNRLANWNNEMRLKAGYPLAYSTPIVSFPIVRNIDDSLFIYPITSDGKVYKKLLRMTNNPVQPVTAYANVERTGYYKQTSIGFFPFLKAHFIKDKTFCYPNPVCTMYDMKLNLQIEVDIKTQVEVKLFDFSGTKIGSFRKLCDAYSPNTWEFDVKNMASGVYIALLKAGDDTMTLKFVIQK